VRKSDGNRQQRQQHSAQRATAIANNKTEGNRQRQQHSAQRATAIAINKSVGNRQQRQQHMRKSDGNRQQQQHHCSQEATEIAKNSSSTIPKSHGNSQKR
jgi:hypothetical protein